MIGYETGIILVVVAAVLVGLIDYLRSGSPLSAAGRIGFTWFDHAEDRGIDQRPSEDEVDLPIPRRPLRGRID